MQTMQWETTPISVSKIHLAKGWLIIAVDSLAYDNAIIANGSASPAIASDRIKITDHPPAQRTSYSLSPEPFGFEINYAVRHEVAPNEVTGRQERG